MGKLRKVHICSYAFSSLSEFLKDFEVKEPQISSIIELKRGISGNKNIIRLLTTSWQHVPLSNPQNALLSRRSCPNKQ